MQAHGNLCKCTEKFTFVLVKIIIYALVRDAFIEVIRAQDMKFLDPGLNSCTDC